MLLSRKDSDTRDLKMPPALLSDLAVRKIHGPSPPRSCFRPRDFSFLGPSVPEASPTLARNPYGSHGSVLQSRSRCFWACCSSSRSAGDRHPAIARRFRRRGGGQRRGRWGGVRRARAADRLHLLPEPPTDSTRDGSFVVEETNDIGTAYLRLDLLPPDARPALRESLRSYLDSRIETYRKTPDHAAARHRWPGPTIARDELRARRSKRSSREARWWRRSTAPRA